MIVGCAINKMPVKKQESIDTGERAMAAEKRPIVERRDFLKILGISGAAATLAGCGNTSIESGVEKVQSYVQPEDFVVPGNSVFYASTCTQCPSHCGVMGRVREGRVLKLEGNPNSIISNGKICGLGQASIQLQYNPDRLTTPMIREGGKLVTASWDQAMKIVNDGLGKDSRIKGNEIVFLTNSVSGHQKVLINNFLESYDSKNHIAYDSLSTQVGDQVRENIYGYTNPVHKIKEARLILSFGNDFLGAGVSPVYLANQYAQFRKAPRGTLIQIEPRMTLTGGNADRWYPIRPGTEGVFALGLANALIQHPEYDTTLPTELTESLKAYDKYTVGQITGINPDAIGHLIAMMWEKTPTLVLSGLSAEGHQQGYQNAYAIELLNVILGNVGKTVTAPMENPFPQMTHVNGNYQGLVALNNQLDAKNVKVLFMMGVNPVYTAPAFIELKNKLSNVPLKIAMVTQLDETAELCDVVLPLLSPVEEFGTHLASYQPEAIEIGIQQPLMEKLHAHTKSFGDVLLTLLKERDEKSYSKYPDYYSYIREAVVKSKPVFKSTLSDDDFWDSALMNGVLHVPLKEAQIDKVKIESVNLPKVETHPEDVNYPFYFVPSVKADMRDGRHANLPWLQESPDPMTTVVWDSWVEINPKTAQDMQVREGDILEIKSSMGSVLAKAYLFPGIQPNTVSIPFGQGHTAYGRYASNRGVNPFKIINPITDEKTGELALFATRVQVTKTALNEKVVKDEGPTTLQQGRKLVATMAADKAELSKEV
ncbi:polysulfide reductase chain A precursor [Ferrovum sp. JA12]|nr:polysulfide reductase chain A precursor [Ferrovum sp. JA12]